MDFAPEFQILIMIWVSLTVAYTGIFPSMKPLTIRRMVYADLIITAGLLCVSGVLFLGKGIGFSLILFQVPWWVYLLVMMSLLETPVFVWFADKHGLKLTDDE